jgi:hypothetical protein
MRFVVAALLGATLVCTPAGGQSSFLGGRALTLLVTDGIREGWIRVTRSCPTGNSCDNGRGGFTSQIERGPGVEPLGSTSGTWYVGHAATIHATASLTDGTVPAGHYLKIYWEGWPRDEDPACKATSGSQCTSSRQMAPPGDPHAPIVCAAFGYESGGTNLGDGFQPVCITLAYRD